MMDIEKLIEDLRGLLKQYGEKIPYGELVGAPWPYSRSGDLVWQDPEPYFIEQAATAISTLQAENEKLRAELEQVKRERDAAVADMEALMWFSGEGCRICAHAVEVHKEPYVRLDCDREKGTDCSPKWRGIKED